MYLSHFKSSLQQAAVLFFLAVGVCLFYSCVPEEDHFIDPATASEQPLLLTDVFGTLTDEYGEAVAGAQVTCHAKSTTTDENGVFYMTDVWAVNGRVICHAHKHGYMSTHYATPYQGDLTSFRMLLSKADEQQINSSLQNSVFFGNAEVKFGPNAFVDTQNGTPYNGIVTVKSKHFDPASPYFKEQMPGGDFRGTAVDGSVYQLISYGAIDVELEGEQGEALNLAAGELATIIVQVPDFLLANAPAHIPLWHFEETVANWEEAGEATLVGNTYVGEVPHFSSWNYDDPVDPDCAISGQVLDCTGNPVPSVPVHVGPLMVYTDADGFYNTNIASDVSFEVYIEQTYDFGLSDAHFDVQALASGEEYAMQDLIMHCTAFVSGNMNNCAGASTSGAILVKPNMVFYELDGSDFNLPIPADEALELVFYQFEDGLTYTETYEVDALEEGASYDLGELTICDEQLCDSDNNCTLNKMEEGVLNMKAYEGNIFDISSDGFKFYLSEGNCDPAEASCLFSLVEFGESFDYPLTEPLILDITHSDGGLINMSGSNCFLEGKIHLLQIDDEHAEGFLQIDEGSCANPDFSGTDIYVEFCVPVIMD